METKRKLIIEGHRGARGLFPENTIEAFIEAIKLGVTTLELDVVISADKQVVVSHEAWMNEDICLDPSGNEIHHSGKEHYNLYKMTYSEISRFDCGTKPYPAFPRQKRLKVHKPLLAEVIEAVDEYCEEHFRKPVCFNIEIKTEPEFDNIYQPEPKEFAHLVYQECKNYQILPRLTLQSFDQRILKELHALQDNTFKISLLVEDSLPYTTHLENLGFKPDVYSPEFILLNEKIINDLHQRNILVIPWTVNEKHDIQRMIDWGADGLITDYPDIAIQTVKELDTCEVLL